MKPGVFGTGRMSWAVTTRKDGRGGANRSVIAGERLWKSRSVETQRQGSHCAWKSRKGRGIPTFPQPRRRRSIDLKPDISCATKTGHFNLLTTQPQNARLPCLRIAATFHSSDGIIYKDRRTVRCTFPVESVIFRGTNRGFTCCSGYSTRYKKPL